MYRLWYYGRESVARVGIVLIRKGETKQKKNVEVGRCGNSGISQTSDAPPGGTGNAARHQPSEYVLSGCP